MGVEHLAPHQFKPGQSGNPAGRPKGSQPSWVSAAHAGRLLGGVPKSHVQRLAAEGLIGVRALSGMNDKYSSADCDKLMVKSVTPAKVLPEG